MYKADIYIACIWREGFEVETLNSLRNQEEFGTCNLTLNNYTDAQYAYVFDALGDDSRITIHRHNNEKTSNEKLRYIATGSNPFIFLVDNDILYPPDFLNYMIAGSIRYNAMCSLHGVIIKMGHIRSYYADRAVYRGLTALPVDVQVDIASNCASVFQRAHFNNLEIWYEHAPVIPMDDILVAYECMCAGVKRVVLAHAEGYIKHKVQRDDEVYVFDQYKNNDIVQTQFINNYFKFKLLDH